MESKQCSKCNKVKSVSEFYKNRANKDGFQGFCKSCFKSCPSSTSEGYRQYYLRNKSTLNAKGRKWINDNKEHVRNYQIKRREKLKGTHYVYLLPEANYVGCTEYPDIRFKEHQRTGRNIDNNRILASFKNRNDALELEEFLHELGYEGGSCTYK